MAARDHAPGTCAATLKSAAPWFKRLFFGDLPLAVEWSLRREPYRWTHSDPNPYLNGHICTLHHDSGVVVWRHSGGAYGDKVQGSHVPTWGGVTALSSIGLSPGHHLIHAAANRWVRFNARSANPGRDIIEALTGSASSPAQVDVASSREAK
jgi:hypothetical protein